MQKFIASLGLMMVSLIAYGQFKPHLNQIEKNQGAPHQIEDIQLKAYSPAIPVVSRPFSGMTANYRTLPTPVSPQLSGQAVKMYYGEGNVVPIAVWGTSDPTPKEGNTLSKVYRHLNEMAKYMKVTATNAAFKVTETIQGKAGNEHVRLQQYHEGIPVYGGELTVHLKEEQVDFMMGRYFPTPNLVTLTPTIAEAQAV